MTAVKLFYSSFSLFKTKPFFLRLILFDWLFLGLWVLQLPTVHAECLEYGQKTLQTRKKCQIAYYYNIIFKQDNHRNYNHLTYNIQDTDAKNEMLRIYLKVHLFPLWCFCSNLPWILKLFFNQMYASPFEKYTVDRKFSQGMTKNNSSPPSLTMTVNLCWKNILIGKYSLNSRIRAFVLEI